jgi:3',5'-cyclic-nucleotide phosphodiesterase
MQLRVLGCAGGSAPGRLLSSYLVDDVLAIDAGALTTALTTRAQHGVRAVALTHGHLDHVWTLPFFLVHRFDSAVPTCGVYASDYTIETVKRHLFNERIWLDIDVLRVEDRPLATWHALEPGGSTQIAGRYAVDAIALTHTVPSQAYCVHDGDHALIVCGDTMTTDAVWAFASGVDGLAGIFVECSWPDAVREIAVASGHMTPAMLAKDLEKLEADVPIHVTHVKPAYEDDTRADLAALADDRIRIAEDGDVLTFG